MKYAAVIFDMDGTIVDTEKIWILATKQLIENSGFSLTDAMAISLEQQVRGLALHASCTIIKECMNLPEPIEELVQEKSRLAQSLYAEGIRFIPGFEEFHRKITERNVPSGIATNADDVTLTLTKKALNLSRFFGQHIYSISCVNNVYKPHPAIYLHAAQQLNVSPTSCIAIEDSAHGIKAAKRAGMFCIGINTHHDQSQLQEADMIIEKYEDIDHSTIFSH